MLVLMHDNQLRGVGLMSFDAVTSFSSNINHAIGLCSSVLDATSFSICTVEPLMQNRATDPTNWQIAKRLCKSAGLTLNYWFVVTRGSVTNVREHN